MPDGQTLARDTASCPTPERMSRHWRPSWVACYRTLLHCLVVASLMTSCTRRSIPPPATVPSRPAPPGPDLRIEYGLASWYGRERHGKRTASGEIYESDKLTAAHRTAPFGTYARVTNLANGRSVEVRINDRGPAIGRRVLDLSYAAARQLDMVRTGVVRVKVEWLTVPFPGSIRGSESILIPSEPLDLIQQPPSLIMREGGSF